MTPLQRVRILKFITSFQIGGSERQFLALARGLDPACFDLRVACIRRTGDFLGMIEDMEVPLSDYAIPSLKSLAAARSSMRLARDMRRDGIEIVHAWGFYPILFAVPAARVARVPVVIASIRDTGEWLTTAQKRAQRLACRFADHVIVNARAVADRLADEGYDTRRVSVIENGIDLDRFPHGASKGELHRELGITEGAPLVALICRLHDSLAVELKGVRHFLEAAALVAREFPVARFLIVGGGSGREEMERCSERLGLAGRVLFTGYRMDVPRILGQITVAVSASTAGEALSNSVLEAMAAGVPVVGTCVGGTSEAIEDGVCGILVPPRDSFALARAVLRYLRNPELASTFGGAARERVARKFSLERMVRETERTYRELLREARSEGAGARGARRARTGARRLAGGVETPRSGW